MSLPDCMQQPARIISLPPVEASEVEDEMLRRLVNKSLKLHDVLQEERREIEDAKLAVSYPSLILIAVPNCLFIFLIFPTTTGGD